MKKITVNNVLFILFITLITCCTKNTNNKTDKMLSGINNECIEVVGVHEIERCGIYINIETNDKGVITYQILDSKGIEKARSPHGFNNYQSWSVCVGSQCSLWVYSSDIGMTIWTVDDAGKYSFWGIEDYKQSVFDDIPKYLLSKYYKIK